MIEYKLTAKAKELKAKGFDCTPRRASTHDAGFDLGACISKPVTLLPGQMVKIPTGVAVWLGDTLQRQTQYSMAYAGLFLPRSSCKGLRLENTVGLLDAGYQKECFLKYRNISDVSVTIKPAQRIAQLIIIPTLIMEWSEVQDFTNQTSRGAGDGSSGDKM